jgi:hypothetical protein
MPCQEEEQGIGQKSYFIIQNYFLNVLYKRNPLSVSFCPIMGLAQYLTILNVTFTALTPS